MLSHLTELPRRSVTYIVVIIYFMNAANLAYGYMHRDIVPVRGRNRRCHHFVTPNFVEENARNILDSLNTDKMCDCLRRFSHKA